MSALTKVLIVLLSLFSIFLCGTVVTYVASANNYKEGFERLQSETKVTLTKLTKTRQNMDEKEKQMQLLEDSLKAQIQALEEANKKLEIDLKNAQRESSGYQGRVNSLAGVLTGFQQTIANLEQSLKLTQEQLDSTREDRIKDRKYLKEIEASLYERIVQMDALEQDKKRLLEEKTRLESSTDEILRPTGIQVEKVAVAPTIQSERQELVIEETASYSTDIKGLVTAMSNSLVTVSVGSADGVKKGMVFHVTRGDEFIRDIIITDVDTDKSAGTLDLGREMPRVGDNVSTSL